MIVTRLLSWGGKSVVGALIGLAFAAGCGGAQPGTAGADTARAQKVSPDGAQVYASECAGCHGDKGEGSGPNPSVMGDNALPREASDRAAIRTAADLHGYIKANMPLPKNRVGSLSDEQYWSVTTYLIVANGKMTPQGGLNADNAASVVINPP